MSDSRADTHADFKNVGDRSRKFVIVEVFGIIALVVLLIFIIMLLTRGSHGPGRHMRGEGRQTPPVVLIENGQQSSS